MNQNTLVTDKKMKELGISYQERKLLKLLPEDILKRIIERGTTLEGNFETNIFFPLEGYSLDEWFYLIAESLCKGLPEMSVHILMNAINIVASLEGVYDTTIINMSSKKYAFYEYPCNDERSKNERELRISFITLDRIVDVLKSMRSGIPSEYMELRMSFRCSEMNKNIRDIVSEFKWKISSQKLKEVFEILFSRMGIFSLKDNITKTFSEHSFIEHSYESQEKWNQMKETKKEEMIQQIQSVLPLSEKEKEILYHLSMGDISYSFHSKRESKKDTINLLLSKNLLYEKRAKNTLTGKIFDKLYLTDLTCFLLIDLMQQKKMEEVELDYKKKWKTLDEKKKKHILEKVQGIVKNGLTDNETKILEIIAETGKFFISDISKEAEARGYFLGAGEDLQHQGAPHQRWASLRRRGNQPDLRSSSKADISDTIRLLALCIQEKE